LALFLGKDVVAVRKIVRIDEEKCNGCGQCIVNCPEGALQIVDGKARVVKESYCDGLGACIGTCPLDAITIEEREAEAFDEAAVKRHMAEAEEQREALPTVGGTGMMPVARGCPGSAVRQMDGWHRHDASGTPGAGSAGLGSPSQLAHWPVQLTLVPPNAPFFHNADLLLVADCVPLAMADFHARFLRGRAVAVGCPKLDDPQAYVGKLAEIFRQSSPRSLTIVHMEVPCCTGLCRIAQMAMEAARREVPVREVTVSVDGRVVADREWERVTK